MRSIGSNRASRRACIAPWRLVQRRCDLTAFTTYRMQLEFETRAAGSLRLQRLHVGRCRLAPKLLQTLLRRCVPLSCSAKMVPTNTEGQALRMPGTRVIRNVDRHVSERYAGLEWPATCSCSVR